MVEDEGEVGAPAQRVVEMHGAAAGDHEHVAHARPGDAPRDVVGDLDHRLLTRSFGSVTPLPPPRPVRRSSHRSTSSAARSIARHALRVPLVQLGDGLVERRGHEIGQLGVQAPAVAAVLDAHALCSRRPPARPLCRGRTTSRASSSEAARLGSRDVVGAVARLVREEALDHRPEVGDRGVVEKAVLAQRDRQAEQRSCRWRSR